MNRCSVADDHATATKCVCVYRWFGTGTEGLADPRELGAAEVLRQPCLNLEEEIPFGSYLVPRLAYRSGTKDERTS